MFFARQRVPEFQQLFNPAFRFFQPTRRDQRFLQKAGKGVEQAVFGSPVLERFQKEESRAIKAPVAAPGTPTSDAALGAAGL